MNLEILSSLNCGLGNDRADVMEKVVGCTTSGQYALCLNSCKACESAWVSLRYVGDNYMCRQVHPNATVTHISTDIGLYD